VQYRYFVLKITFVRYWLIAFLMKVPLKIVTSPFTQIKNYFRLLPFFKCCANRAGRLRRYVFTLYCE
jgi:hypothetical protein